MYERVFIIAAVPTRRCQGQRVVWTGSVLYSRGALGEESKPRTDGSLAYPWTPRDTALRYKTIRELGRGGMGVTFLADTPTGEQVVLKRLKLERLDNWKALELFEREARVLKALNHPGIPSYIDSIEDQGSGTFTLVQSLAAGKNLRHWVDEGWRPTEQDVIAIAEQVLDVLVYLQGLNPPVVHRDIKPSNLVRTKDGEIAVVDFGAVRDAYEETITGGSTIVGTFGYMAPEQLRGNADHTSDLYGLGATLLFCLTHQEPNDLPQQRMRYVFKDLTQLSSGLESWIAKLVEPHTEDRFPDARSARKALRAAAAPSPEVPQPFHGILGHRDPRQRPHSPPAPARKATTPWRISPVPSGSRIEVAQRGEQAAIRLNRRMVAPATKYKLGFLLLWLGFLAIFTLIASAMVGSFAAICAPFWFLGIRSLFRSLRTMFLVKSLHFQGERLTLQETVVRSVDRANLEADRIRAITRGTSLTQEPGQPPGLTIQIEEGMLTYEVAEGLTDDEQHWLLDNLRAWHRAAARDTVVVDGERVELEWQAPTPYE